MLSGAASAMLNSLAKSKTIQEKHGMKQRSRSSAKGKATGTSLSNDVYDQPGHLIRRAQQIAVSMFYSTVGSEVTPVQYAVLRILQDYPGIDQVTLARLCALDTSTAANLAVRLEERGLVTRVVPASSKRFRLLRVTPQGTALLKNLLPSGRLLSRRLLQALDKQEQKTFLRLLKKFVHLNNEESRAPLGRVESAKENIDGTRSASRRNNSQY